MKRDLCWAIDIGSSKIAIVVFDERQSFPESIVAHTSAASRGVKNANVVNVDELGDALRSAISKLQTQVKEKPRRAVVAMSSSSAQSSNSYGVVRIMQSHVSAHDIKRVHEIASAIPLETNQVIAHAISQNYALDYMLSESAPIGMRGVRLEMNAHLILLQRESVAHVKSILRSLGINNSSICYQPLASADYHFTQNDKELGTCLLDIGHATTDMVVYSQNRVFYSATIALGGKDAISAISKKFDLPHEQAKQIIFNHGKLCRDEDKIEHGKVEIQGDRLSYQFDKADLNAELSLVYEAIFEKVLDHLEEIPYGIKLAGGVQLTGGAAKVKGAEEFAKDCLSLQAICAHRDVALDAALAQPEYSAVLGLIVQRKAEQGSELAQAKNFMAKLKQMWQTHF